MIIIPIFFLDKLKNKKSIGKDPLLKGNFRNKSVSQKIKSIDIKSKEYDLKKPEELNISYELQMLHVYFLIIFLFSH